MKFLSISIVLFCSFTYAQVLTRGEGQIVNGSNFNFLDNLKISNALLNNEDGESISYENIEGTPYIDNYIGANNNLPLGKIYTKDFTYIETAFVRYNAYTDNMEVSLMEDGVDYYLLKKLPDFLYVVLNKKKYRAYEYGLNGRKNIGYFVIASESDTLPLTLLRKESVIFKKEEKPKSSFLASTPPHFIKLKDNYYIKLNDRILEVPNKKKDLHTLFTDKINEVKEFIDSSKVRPNNEDDLIRLINFYNSLFN